MLAEQKAMVEKVARGDVWYFIETAPEETVSEEWLAQQFSDTRDFENLDDETYRACFDYYVECAKRVFAEARPVRRWRIHWVDGRAEEIEGRTPAEAFSRAGIGACATPAINYYEPLGVKA